METGASGHSGALAPNPVGLVWECVWDPAIIRPLQKRAETVWDITPRKWTANQETAVSARGKNSFQCSEKQGSVLEWLGHWNWNPEVAGSSSALTIKLELFLGRPYFYSTFMLVNSQLICLRQVGIFKPIMIVWNIFSFSSSGMPEN